MTLKNSVVVFIFYRDEILLKHQYHEGYEIIDLVGSFVNNDASSEHKVDEVLSELGLMNKRLLKPHGSIRNIIHKPGEDVDLRIQLYKLEINQKLVRPNKNYFWFDRAVASDSRARRIRRIVEIAFDTNPVNIYWEENQYGKWIDSETVVWKLDPDIDTLSGNKET